MKKIGGLLIFLLFANLRLFSQINWISRPGSLQLYPRNLSNNRANVSISGNVIVAGYSAIGLKVFQNGKSYSSQNTFLSYNSGRAFFKFDVILPAGKFYYDILATLDSAGFQRTVLYAKRVVVGDAYLISGQSNSVANAYVGLSNPGYRDSFIRSFGNSGPNVTGVADSNWYLADGDALYNAGAIGQWGLVLGKQIIDSLGMPVCFINAGVGGTTIGFHQKNNNNPTDISTNYGRMLLRATRAGYADKIRGIFWFQGESDGANAIGHDTLFRKMYRDWLSDYKAIEKVYPVQVRSGCGSPSLILRDKQRMLKTLSKCTVLTANGLNAHDGCHYGFVNGYESLGQQLFSIVKTDLYKGKRNENNYCPEPNLAYFSNNDQTLICVELSNPGATFTVDTLFHQLFKLEGTTSRITNGWIFKNRLYLKLDKSDCNLKGISYDGLAGNKPWVKTALGVAMLSFYNHPILKSAPLSTVKACRGNVVNLGRDSIPGVKYDWKGMTGGKTYNIAKPYHKAENSELFRLILTYGTSSCNKDTLWQSVIADTVSSISLPDTIRFCFGDSITLGQKKGDWASSFWYKNGKMESAGFQVKAFEKARWVQLITGFNGCRTEDSVWMLPEKQFKNMLSDLFYRCPGDSLLIRSAYKGKKYEWNGYQSVDSFHVLPDMSDIALVVSDSSGCRWHDSASIVNKLPIDIDIVENFAFCPGSSISIALPSSHSFYFLNGQKVINSLTLNKTGNFTLTAKDSQGCKTEKILTIKKWPEPRLIVRDSGFCNGDFLEITAPLHFTNYTWSHAYTGKTAVFIKSGSYWLEVNDSNQCKKRDSFSILVSDKAVWQLATDTLICFGDSIQIEPYKQDIRWFWQGNEFTGKTFKIKSAGKYEFMAESSPFCRVKHQYSVRSIVCQSGLHVAKKDNITIRSFNGKLLIDSDKMNLMEVSVYNTTGRKIISSICRGNSFESALPSASQEVLLVLVKFKNNSGEWFIKREKILFN